MQRRKFIAGVGSLAAAGAAGIGTGAFSAMSAGREADVDVVNDANGLVALTTGPAADDRVYEADNGELKIDFTSNQGGTGVNVNSRYQVGVWNTAGGMNYTDVDASDLLEGSGGGITPAFLIINQDTSEHGVSVEYEVDNPGQIGDASLHFQFIPQGGQSNANKQGIDIDDANPTDSWGPEPTPSGHQWASAIFVDTRGTTTDSADLDLSGTLTVNAN